VNGVKSTSASPLDIELVRAGSSAPQNTVGIGNELRTGDTIATKDNDQVVLRVPNSASGSDDLVFLDPDSKVAIESVCAVAGRIFAWAGVRFRLCTAWGTLGVEGTQFEVNITPAGEMTVSVDEGLVKLTDVPLDQPKSDSGSKAVSASRLRATLIRPDSQLKIKPDGTTEDIEATAEGKVKRIDYWSDQIIKASKPATAVTKDFVNYTTDTRAEEFKQARRAALTAASGTASDTAYLQMAKVMNDWNEGTAAEKSLAKVKSITLRSSAEYMVNLAEAERLQGNLVLARAQLEATVATHQDYAPAYLLKAKVLEQSGIVDPEHMRFDEIRTNLTAALVYDNGRGHINTTAVENDLDMSLKAVGSKAVRRDTWLSGGSNWLDPTPEVVGVQFAGNASVNLRNGRRAKGPAVLAISGDQFKLKVGEELFTGRIVGSTYARGASFAMQFDDVGRVDKAAGTTVFSVTGSKTGNSLTLTAAAQSAGSFSFTTTRLQASPF